MAEIVNLRRVKKRLSRDREVQEARENRVRFGRTGTQKLRDRLTEAARARALDGRIREDAPGDPVDSG